MIASTQGRLLSAQVHLKVLEKVNVLGKNYNKKMKNTYLLKYLFKLLCIVHMAKATTVLFWSKLICLLVSLCLPSCSSAWLFVILEVTTKEVLEKGQQVSKQTKNPFTFCCMTFAIAFYRDTFIKDATRHSPRTDSASRNSLSTS